MRLYQALMIFVLLATTSHAEIPWKYWEHANDFTDKDLSHYSKTHIYKCSFNCKKNYKAYEFIEEKNGNVFIALRSREGQLAKFNNQKNAGKDE